MYSERIEQIRCLGPATYLRRRTTYPERLPAESEARVLITGMEATYCASGREVKLTLSLRVSSETVDG